MHISYIIGYANVYHTYTYFSTFICIFVHIFFVIMPRLGSPLYSYEIFLSICSQAFFIQTI